MARHSPFSRLGLLHVHLLPLFAFFQYKSFRIFERFEEAFPLDDIAGLTTGDEVFHLSRPAVCVGVNMVNRKDEPV